MHVNALKVLYRAPGASLLNQTATQIYPAGVGNVLMSILSYCLGFQAALPAKYNRHRGQYVSLFANH